MPPARSIVTLRTRLEFHGVGAVIRGPRLTPHVLISAHGQRMSSPRHGQESTDVPSGCRVHRYIPHGHVLQTFVMPGQYQGARVSMTQATNALLTDNARVIATDTSQSVNYTLECGQTDGEETILGIEFAMCRAVQKRYPAIDVLVIEPGVKVDLSYLLTVLFSYGHYRDIHCNFCCASDSSASAPRTRIRLRRSDEPRLFGDPSNYPPTWFDGAPRGFKTNVFNPAASSPRRMAYSRR